MKIGLPAALMHYYYYPLWEKLFQELGAEIVISDATSGGILSEGVKATVSELCVPIKVYNAHILNLLDKDVDYCFVPRFVSLKGKEWYCPKFLGLPALVQYSIPDIQDKMLVLDIEGNREDTCDVKNYLPLCDALSVTKQQLKDALKTAQKHYEEFMEIVRQGHTIDEAHIIQKGGKINTAYKNSPITIGVLGYVYNVYDKFVSMDIINRLRKANINILTFEMLDEKDLHNQSTDEEKPLFWVFARKIYNAGKRLMKNKKVDGLIHVTAFACGPDAVIGKLLEIESEKTGVPFMTIRVDEHSGESHIQTRIEAFTDMLIRKKGVSL